MRMKIIIISLIIGIVGASAAMAQTAAQPPSLRLEAAEEAALREPIEMRLQGCVHDGSDVVVIFSILNKTKHDLNCVLGKSGLGSTFVEADDGLTFTNAECYVEGKKVSGRTGSIAFPLPAERHTLLSLVLDDIPDSVLTLKEIQVPMRVAGREPVSCRFSNVTVLSEKATRALMRTKK